MKNLTTRISKLEQIQPNHGLSADAIALLVAIIGKRDAIFWPWRYHSGASSPPLAEIMRRQKAYLAHDEGIVAKADGKGQWKSAFERRQELLTSGDIEANFSGGQVTSCFLTAKGEAKARAMAGLHTFEDSRIVFERIQEVSEAKRRSIRESELFGKELFDDPNSWNSWTETVLPLLTSGCVGSSSDSTGRIYYGVRENVPEPEPIESDAAYSQSMQDIYFRAWKSERRVLASAPPQNPNELYIPLPASGII